LEFFTFLQLYIGAEMVLIWYAKNQ